MNKTIKSYKDLDTWIIAVELVTKIYILTSYFPNEERFGITSQIRRSAISIPSNIAEGYGRWGKGEYIRFCRIAFGSAAELETQLHIAKKLLLAESSFFTEAEDLLGQVQRLLNKLIHALIK